MVRNGCKVDTHSGEDWGLRSHVGCHKVQQRQSSPGHCCQQVCLATAGLLRWFLLRKCFVKPSDISGGCKFRAGQKFIHEFCERDFSVGEVI